MAAAYACAGGGLSSAARFAHSGVWTQNRPPDGFVQSGTPSLTLGSSSAENVPRTFSNLEELVGATGIEPVTPPV